MSLNSKTSLDLLIKNAQTFVPDPSKPNGLRSELIHIGCKSGKISELSSTEIQTPATEVIDAKGLTVLPGMIDSQVHFREPGLTHKEDLESGTRAAALGGITAIFEMPNTKPPTVSVEYLKEKLKLASGKCHVDFAFYGGAAHSNIAHLAELESQPGCPGIKLFLGSSTGSLLVEDDTSLEQILRGTKKRLTIHSEDEYLLRERKHIAEASGDVRMHPVWRNEEVCLNATRRVLNLARKLSHPVHILHVTTAQEMELLAQNKDLATVEVLPQHLTLFAPDCYEKFGTFAQQNPPIREKYHQDALWKAIGDRVVDVIGSDHAPHTKDEKSKPYPLSPSGMPSVQTLLPLMLTHVAEGRLGLDRLVELMTLGVIKVFGLKNKGKVQVGYDADFTLVDLKKRQVIDSKWLASKCGWSPFEGFTAKGWPIMTIVRGQVVMAEDELRLPGRGQACQFVQPANSFEKFGS
jgi:dihydroorotase